MIEKPSPNFNKRKGVDAPYMLILHYTGTKTAEEADAIYMTPDHVSPHYMIDRDGSITKYVDEENRAWHAGASSWDDRKDINSTSIGIEIVNGGHEYGLEEFPDIQISKLIDMIKDIRTRWHIPDHYILAHSDISPGRKIDPGENFPWTLLRENGVGLMPDMRARPDPDDHRELVSILKNIGYDYTDNASIIIEEFRRHYMPETFGLDMDYERLRRAALSILNQKLTSI